jgi:glycosyltransferase involved in cell wall biosynthesis
MRILIASPTLPYPQSSGYAIRVFQVVHRLQQRHSVTLLAYADASEERQSITELRAHVPDLHIVPRSTARVGSKRVEQLATLLSRQSFQRRHQYSAAFQQKLDELSRRAAYDVINIETSGLAGLRFDPRAALVLTEHDIVYELLYRMYQTERSPFRRLYNRMEYAKVRRDEIRTWRTVAGCVTTSPREERIIHEFAPATPILVAPNGVDVDYFAPGDEPIDPNALVMTGFMKTRPNIDGALFFVREVLPRIRAVRPQVVVYLVGAAPPDEVRRLAGEHVIVTDAVPDVRPYVRRAAVFVVPLRMGGGTRLKVLEGLSMRKPMVSTSLGCEGIDVEDKRHLLIADDADGFAGAVLRLLDDPALGRQLAGEGQQRVLSQYRWAGIVDRQEGFFEQLLERRAAGRERQAAKY